MKTRVSGQLSLRCLAPCLLVVACSGGAPPPPREAPVEPLVIGTSEPAVVARRLAEHYADLARTSDATSAGANARVAVARKGALENYLVVIQDAPDDPKIDEAYYYAGLAYELGGDWLNARKSYFEVIKRVPSSRLAPYAYFAFGELFLAEAQADPTRYDLAEQAYKEVLKVPAPENGLYAEAKRRLAEVTQQSAGKLTRP